MSDPERMPPHADEAEQSLLAVVLEDNAVLRHVDHLRPDDFRVDANRRLWGHYLDMQTAGTPIDATTIVSRLHETGDWEPCGGLEYLGSIFTLHPVPNYAPFYARTVKDRATRRRLANLGTEISEAAGNGESTGTLVSRLRQQLDELGDHASGITYPRITCADLDANEYAVDYLIRGVLVDRQPCILAGPKKSMKTTFIVDLAVSLATGGHFLGYFKSERACRVAVMSGESGMPTIQETARRIARAAGWQLADIGDAILFSDRLPILGNVEYLSALRKYLLDNAVEILFVDPVYMVMGNGDTAGNLFAQGATLRTIGDLCQEAGATLVLAHHTRKNRVDAYQQPELEDIAWSGFQEWARQWLLIGRREQYEPGTGVHRLWLSVGGSAGHSGLWAVDVDEGTGDASTGRQWEVSVSSAPEARRAVEQRREADRTAKRKQQVDADSERIANVLVKYPAGQTMSAIRLACGGFRGFPAAFAALVDAGTIVPCEIQKANRVKPYKGYKLAER